MIEWSEQHQMIRDMVRRFVEAEIKPRLTEFEHGDVPPYDVLRKMMAAFGIDEMARQRFQRQLEREKAAARGEAPAKTVRERTAEDIGMQLIPVIELCHYCPGMVTALGVSVGLTPAAIISRGTIRQKERWALPLLTLEKIGAWAITEPGSGSDAFGGMKSTARRNAEGYVLNGNKTFITNGPYADTIVFICKLDDGSDPKQRKVLSFVLDKGTPGLTQSKPMRKMGLHSSPTGELFLEDVHVGPERLIGETEDVPARAGAKQTFSQERTGVAAMALGIVEQCLVLCVNYARTRIQFGRPIGEFQLIQLKLPDRHGGGRPADGSRRGLGLQTLRRAGRGRGHARGGPALRRERLHGRVPGRAALPRRQGPPDLRRHRRDPGLADRPQPAHGGGSVT